MTAVIRPIRAEDAPELARIESAVFSSPWSEQAFAKLPEQPYCIYMVAEIEGIVIGCAGLTLLGEEGDIDKVMVKEDFRRRGIARLLLEKLMYESKRLGVKEFTLEVRAGNETAIRLYESLGFASEGIRPKFYVKPVEDAVIMWKRSG